MTKRKNVFRKPILIPTTVILRYIILLYMFSYDTTTHGSYRTHRYALCENIFRDGFAVNKIALLDAISFIHKIVFLLRISFLISLCTSIFVSRPYDFSDGKNWSENRRKLKISWLGNYYGGNNKNCNATVMFYEKLQKYDGDNIS